MKPKIDELLAILQKETDCYRTMQTVLAKEEESIGLSGKNRFDRVQGEKEDLVAKIGKLETIRRQLVDRMASSPDDGSPSVTVSQLADRLDAPDNQRLRSQAVELRSLIAKVHVQNKRNQQLIDQYLHLVKGSLHLLTNLMDSSPTYMKPGTRQPANGCRTGNGRFIRGSV